MIQDPRTSLPLKPLLLLFAMLTLSACEGQSPYGIRYKMTASAPATDSLVESYGQLAEEMWTDTQDVLQADRWRHGVHPALDTIPKQVAEPQAVAFDHYNSMYFKVYKVEVVDQYAAPVSTNYDDHLPVTATEAVHSWAGRLRPTGGVNKLQVVIKDARMVPQPGSDADKRYDVSLAVEMRITDRNGVVLASVTTSAAQSANIKSINDYDGRKASLNAMLLKLIDSTNAQLEMQLAKNFSSFIDRSKA